ncbi:MAG TPA: Crp/Fnr family transcriptional regulator [Herpetosiphonaceae bacterium]|nr:Crp/Fnr family transcriptional regulator [Herpetosiphonaceae bacterium]
MSQRELDKQGYLRDIDIFQDLSPDEVETLGHRAPMQTVEAGTVFYSPEDASEVLFILKVGRVRMYRLSADGKALTTALIDAGTIFGEMAILGQGMHDSYAEALTPCVLCLMSRDDVKRLLLGDQRVALRITETMGRRLLEAERRLSDFAFKSLPERIATVLVTLAEREPSRFSMWPGRSSRPELRFTHEQLAEMVGTHRETATKVLNDWREQGLIELKRGKVVLMDLEALRRLSAD